MHSWSLAPTVCLLVQPRFVLCNQSFSPIKKSDKSTKVIENCRKRMWGSLILDEVHLAPADTFRKVTTEIRAHVKFGERKWLHKILI